MDMTMKEMADQLLVDKQRVYRFIKRNQIQEARQENGVLYYNEAAQRLIETGLKSVNHLSEALPKQTHETSLGVIIELLRQELEVKNEQIRNLNARLAESNAALVSAQQAAQMAQKTAQAAQALHAGTMQQTGKTLSARTDQAGTAAKNPPPEFVRNRLPHPPKRPKGKPQGFWNRLLNSQR